MSDSRPRDIATAEEGLRLFVAIELPGKWIEALQAVTGRIQAALALDPLTRDIRPRWVRPEGMHLTLKFLGQTEATRVAAIEQALARAVPQSPGLELGLGRTGTFGRPPRVVWVSVAGQVEALAVLAQRIDAALEPAGFARERRPFAGHLTLARLADNVAAASRTRVATLLRGMPVPPRTQFRVQQVSLIRSHLGPGGARYERLRSFSIDQDPES